MEKKRKEKTGQDLQEGWYVEKMKESIRGILPTLFQHQTPNDSYMKTLQKIVDNKNNLDIIEDEYIRLIISRNCCN